MTGIAVDSAGNAYLAGSTTDPNGSFMPTNGFQPTYGGDPYDGFVMKILPSGNGMQDLSYGTFLGGSGSDQALAIAVSAALPGTVYVTGATSSKNFPVNGQVAAYQPKLAQSTSANSNAFLSVITQDPTTFKTALAYSTYLGGSQTDQGNAVYFAGQQQIFIAGTTTRGIFRGAKICNRSTASPAPFSWRWIPRRRAWRRCCSPRRSPVRWPTARPCRMGIPWP